MKAVVILELGKAGLKEIPEPVMRSNYIKIKTVAVAVNPTDFYHVGGAGLIGGILGCDLSGIVEQVGSDCKTNVQKGDRVYGVSHGANLNNAEDGAFAEYALVVDGHVAKIPDGMSFEEAATLGVGTTTIGQSLYMTLKLPLPTEPATIPFPILISGGSSATGLLAIQYAKLSGLTVVSTTSPKHFELVKSRGADAVFDYNDPDCGKKIREYTNNSLQYVLDPICTETSFKICAEALPSAEDAEGELKLLALLPLDKWPRTDVNATVLLCYTTFGEAFSKFGQDFPAIKECWEHGEMFWKLTNTLLREGKIKNHPVALRPNGLQGVVAGVTELSTGSVSGVKLVYKVDETPENVAELPNSSDTPALRGPILKNW